MLCVNLHYLSYVWAYVLCLCVHMEKGYAYMLIYKNKSGHEIKALGLSLDLRFEMSGAFNPSRVVSLMT